MFFISSLSSRSTVVIRNDNSDSYVHSLIAARVFGSTRNEIQNIVWIPIGNGRLRLKNKLKYISKIKIHFCGDSSIVNDYYMNLAIYRVCYTLLEWKNHGIWRTSRFISLYFIFCFQSYDQLNNRRVPSHFPMYRIVFLSSLYDFIPVTFVTRFINYILNLPLLGLPSMSL